MYSIIFNQPLEKFEKLKKNSTMDSFFQAERIDTFHCRFRRNNCLQNREKSVSHTRNFLSLGVVVISDGDTLHINLKLLGPMQVLHLLTDVAVAQQRMCGYQHLIVGCMYTVSFTLHNHFFFIRETELQGV